MVDHSSLHNDLIQNCILHRLGLTAARHDRHDYGETTTEEGVRGVQQMDN